MDRAELERDARKAVRSAADGDESSGADELDELRDALDELTAKVERLVSLHAEARNTSSRP